MLLFKSIDDIKVFCGGLTKGTDFSQLSGPIELATALFIKPVLGDAQLDALLTAVHAEGDLPNELADLLPRVQMPLANFTMADVTQAALLMVGNAGTVEAAVEHTTAPRQWVVNAAVRRFETAAWQGIELLLEFLERHQDDYELWRNSAAFTERNELTLKNAEQLGRYVGINGSRRTYLAMRPYIERAEELYLSDLMGDDLFAAYKEALASGAPSAWMLKLRDKAAPVVAHAAVHEGLQEAVFMVADEGIRVQASTDRSAESNSGDPQLIANRIEHHVSKQKRFGVALYQFLEANASQFPDFVPKGQNSRVPLPEQDSSGSLFIL